MRNTGLYCKKHVYISNTKLKSTKNQAKAKQHPKAKLLLFENYLLSSSALSSRNNVHILKNVQKNKCAYFNEIILILINVKIKMKNRSHRSDVNRTRARHGHKYTKY